MSSYTTAALVVTHTGTSTHPVRPPRLDEIVSLLINESYIFHSACCLCSWLLSAPPAAACGLPAVLELAMDEGGGAVEMGGGFRLEVRSMLLSPATSLLVLDGPGLRSSMVVLVVVFFAMSVEVAGRVEDVLASKRAFFNTLMM